MLLDSSEPKVSQKKFHYGFVIIAAGFLTQFIVLGAQRLPALSLELIRESLGITYAEVGLIVSWYTVFYAGAAFVWGLVADKIGCRLTLTVSIGFAAVGAFLFGTIGATSYLLAIVTWSFAGFGIAGLYLATIPKLIASWFAPDKRGFFSSLVYVGGSTASIVMGIVIPIIIVNLGWSASFLVFGGFCLVIGLFVFVFVRNEPKEKGLDPYGLPAGTQLAPAPQVVADKSESVFIHVLKLPITWHIGLMQVFYQLAYMTLVTFYVAAITSIGFTTAEAGIAITLGGIANFILLPIWGHLADRYNPNRIMPISNVCAAVICFAYFMLLQNSPELWICWLFTAVITGVVGQSPVISTICSNSFERKYRGTGPGITSTIGVIGRYLGPWLAGMIIDATTGNVAYAFAFAAVALIGCAIVAFTLPKPSAETLA